MNSGISVLILTLNEERNLPRCLDALSWSDDIVVIDSFSTDSTAEIARSAGARLFSFKHGSELTQRQASLRIDFKNPWVFNPDADEVAPPDLVREMIGCVRNRELPYVAYRLRFKNMFRGRWLKHSSLYPTWIVRLFRPERLSFERSTNLRYLVDGPVGKLSGHLQHYSFNNGIAAWIEKHNRYSSFEARETLASLTGTSVNWRRIASSDPVERRRALKELSFRLPCRSLARFFYMYVLRLGLLDGSAGLSYCALLAIYEYFITLKVDELTRLKRDESI